MVVEVLFSIFLEDGVYSAYTYTVCRSRNCVKQFFVK